MTQYYSRTDINYAGDSNFTIPFTYISKDDVHVYVNDTEISTWTWLNDSQINITSTLQTGDVISIRRSTPIDEKIVTYQNMSMVLNDNNLNLSQDQLLDAVQEVYDNNVIFKADTEASFNAYKDTVDTAITAIDAKANTAISTANTAKSTADTAKSTADTALANSATAVSNSETAISTANAASTAANNAVSTANTASTNASTAVSTANSASSAASTAVSTANSASTAASNAVSTANTASTNASTAINKADEAIAIAQTAVSQGITPATTSQIGGIIVGTNLSITAEGVLSADAQSITVDDELSSSSENPVQNKVVKSVIDTKQDTLRAGTNLEIVQTAGESRTVSGTNSISLSNAAANALSSVIVYGACSQSGNPTTSNPVDIVCNNGAIRYNTSTHEFYADGTAETITDSLNNSATAEMLLAIGDLVDTQNLLGNGGTRKVGLLVLDGTEEFNTNTLSNCYSLATSLGDVNQTDRTVYCTHFQHASTLPNANSRQGYALIGNISTPSVGFTVGFGATTEFATVDLFKTWLAQQYANGTPVIVAYPLASPTAFYATAQTLTTKAGSTGSNELTISQAAISNLSIKATYTTDSSSTINFTNNSGYITSASLAALTDVSLTNVANGDALVYNSTSQKWKNGSVQITVDQTFDGTSTNPQSGVAIQSKIDTLTPSVQNVATLTATNGACNIELDYVNSIYALIEPSAAVEFTFDTTNLTLDSSTAYTFELYIDMPFSRALSFTDTILWEDDTIPTFGDGQFLLVFRTLDGGSSWLGNLQGVW